jgi:NTP pyrophosphatase (non-canonical NTP hydrolase)
MKITILDEERQLFARFQEHYGANAQFTMLVEEMAELIVALSHSLRERGSKAAIIAEIADVYITLAQVADIMETLRSSDEDGVDAQIHKKLLRMQQVADGWEDAL